VWMYPLLTHMPSWCAQRNVSLYFAVLQILKGSALFIYFILFCATGSEFVNAGTLILLGEEFC